MKNILMVGLGGGIGSIFRYLCQRWFLFAGLHPVPWATLTVNIAGCFLIGIFWGLTFGSFDTNETWKLFLMTGICGGFTTFSAFSLEGIGLIKEEKFFLFFTYVILSVAGGIIATWLGMRMTRL
jgi:CrcB protein